MALTARRARSDAAADVPVSSFSDVAFLLIIFFILASDFDKPMGMVTELPSGEKSQAQQTDEKANIINLHEGQITFNDNRTDLESLRKSLAGLRLETKEGNDRIVMLEATGHVPYQLYYDVMLSISNSGGVIGIVREEGK